MRTSLLALLLAPALALGGCTPTVAPNGDEADRTGGLTGPRDEEPAEPAPAEQPGVIAGVRPSRSLHVVPNYFEGNGMSATQVVMLQAINLDADGTFTAWLANITTETLFPRPFPEPVRGTYSFTSEPRVLANEPIGRDQYPIDPRYYDRTTDGTVLDGYTHYLDLKAPNGVRRFAYFLETDGAWHITAVGSRVTVVTDPMLHSRYCAVNDDCAPLPQPDGSPSSCVVEPQDEGAPPELDAGICMAL